MLNMYSRSTTTYTLNVNLDSYPNKVSWYILDVSMSKIFLQSNSTQLAIMEPYSTITQTFTLSNDQYYTFYIQSILSRGIACKNKASCFNITIHNSFNNNIEEPFLIGNGIFTCYELYNIGKDLPPLQPPVSRGCPVIPIRNNSTTLSLGDLFLPLGMILASFFLLLLVRTIISHRSTRHEQIRLEQERCLEEEVGRKLYAAQIESLTLLLPNKTLNHIQVHTTVIHGDPSSNDCLDVVDTCPICLDIFLDGNEICSSINKLCPHYYHTACIYNWLLRPETKLICPVCRNDFVVVPSRLDDSVSLDDP